MSTSDLVYEKINGLLTCNVPDIFARSCTCSSRFSQGGSHETGTRHTAHSRVHKCFDHDEEREGRKSGFPDCHGLVLLFQTHSQKIQKVTNNVKILWRWIESGGMVSACPLSQSEF